jgi:hypothetical protein
MKELNPITTVALIMSCILLLFAAYGAYRLIGLWWSNIKADRIMDLYIFCESIYMIENVMDTDFSNKHQEYVKGQIWKLGLTTGYDSAKKEQIDVLLRKYSQKYFGK